MTISTAFLGEITRGKWIIHYVDKGRNFRVGETLEVKGPRHGCSISKVVIRNKRGDIKRVLSPLRGSLSIKATENDILTISFDYKNERKYREKFFLRFFFFKNDPSVFRFQSHPFIDHDDGHDCCEETQYMMYSMQDDGDKGGGGPDNVFG